MAMPEYYLTDAELEIYQNCGPELLSAIDGRPFDLIELGAGDGSKTRFLIDTFISAGAKFTYRPVDISENAIEMLSRRVKQAWPNLAYAPLNDDYFAALKRLGEPANDAIRLVLFPGANIGNFNQEEAAGFLRHLRKFLNPGDLLLTLVSCAQQTAIVSALESSFEFDAWEAISVEVSQKYGEREIEDLAARAGFTHLQHLKDTNGLFSDSLWRV